MKKIALILCLTMALGGLTIRSAQADKTQDRTDIIVISDIHLGADDAFAEINENKAALLSFLKEVRMSQKTAELVIAGDLIDQWFLPMGYEAPQTLWMLNDLVAQNNQEIFDEIKGIIADGLIKVTYIPGNHDINFTREEAQRLFPGIKQARDAQGLGTYWTGGHEIALEHGHRYNIFVAPDSLSNRDIVNDQNAILPCGYFFTRIAASSVVEGKPKTNNVFGDIPAPISGDEAQMAYYALYRVWENLLTALPVEESFDDRGIKTDIDGYAGTFAINDLIPYQDSQGNITVKLYDGMVESWEERQAINLVKAPFSAREAIVGAASNPFTDRQALTQYFDLDPGVKLVVFGHTHEALINRLTNLEGADVLYANSGTWVDHYYDFPVRTYLVVSPADQALEVSLFQYALDGSSQLLSQETISK